MLRALYDRVISLAGHRHALWFLAAISFVESSVFPIPPDVLLIPMIIARPNRAWLIAGVCTLASVLGGMLGYFIGAELFDLVGKPVLDFYGKGEQFAEFSATFNEYGAWAVLVAGVTPFPYKVITIASGATGLSLGVFIVASIVARALRFFLIGALLWKFGPPVRDFIENRLGLVATVSVVLLFGGFLLVKLF
ncbi:YqaA family protein [Oceanicella sp. SM1341]|uniref:YqaA family protein n=1 Tax=Oceanicella sp. SM1341 TaxID=1548889 RepID=UPI000E5094F3|nr:YqaA family protein [Oceanicella sp. SM1341]